MESEEEISIEETVLEGSFLPVTALLASGSLSIKDLNEMVFDPSQGAKLIHYLGHFGNIKALRYFMSEGLDIN